jgi:hypothetical protein
MTVTDKTCEAWNIPCCMNTEPVLGSVFKLAKAKVRNCKVELGDFYE